MKCPLLVLPELHLPGPSGRIWKINLQSSRVPCSLPIWQLKRKDQIQEGCEKMCPILDCLIHFYSYETCVLVRFKRHKAREKPHLCHLQTKQDWEPHVWKYKVMLSENITQKCYTLANLLIPRTGSLPYSASTLQTGTKYQLLELHCLWRLIGSLHMFVSAPLTQLNHNKYSCIPTSGDHWQSLVFLEFIILIILNKQFCSKSFFNLPIALTNELDWPQLSGTTGFLHSTSSLSRNQLLDYPAIVIYAMIGNDVCSGNIDPLPEMTTPEKLYSKVMQTLQYLDSHLPNGSHVILHGLPDGRFLWDHLHDRYHPLGQLNKDVTYAHFYSFLNCLQVSPCHGWMSSNKTLRNLTSERAEQLSTTLKKIATSQKFMNFDLFYLDFDFQKIVKKWQKRGGQPWQLIEPVDGFHPNEVVSQLFADLFWEKMQRQWPHVLGKENPFNPQIEQVFGDQGGH
ncbi:hypothetical protein FD755_012223 [Muntiacus reevesi]|uniref:Acyloxyacyl hydrolase n=1 Tax=Muntiacus reevesi TaxID=9886 RepID=A0A5N3XQF6_MUNRE|nr:hypothetical protein FD755_012223 [Muntiacus reevesi]